MSWNRPIFGRRWALELRTDMPHDGEVQASAGEVLTVPALALILLRREN